MKIMKKIRKKGKKNKENRQSWNHYGLPDPDDGTRSLQSAVLWLTWHG